MHMIAPFGITVCGIEELDLHGTAGITHVLSILDPDYPVPEAFAGFAAHEKLELRFNDVIEPSPTTLPPNESHIRQLLDFGRAIGPGDNLLVHCHAGVSRSTASMALILAQAMPQHSAAEVLAEVLRIRGRAWPNLRMVEMGDPMLDRGGALVAALHGVYRSQIVERPWLAAEMERLGRSRELAAAGVAGGSVSSSP